MKLRGRCVESILKEVGGGQWGTEYGKEKLYTYTKSLKNTYKYYKT